VILCSQVEHLVVTVRDSRSSSSSWSASRHSVTAEYKMTSTGEIKVDATLACVRPVLQTTRSMVTLVCRHRQVSLPCEELATTDPDVILSYNQSQTAVHYTHRRSSTSYQPLNDFRLPSPAPDPMYSSLSVDSLCSP